MKLLSPSECWTRHSPRSSGCSAQTRLGWESIQSQERNPYTHTHTHTCRGPSRRGSILALLAVCVGGCFSPDHRGCPTAAVAAAAAAEAQQEQEGAQDACEEGLLALDFWEREEGVSKEAPLPRGRLLDQPQAQAGEGRLTPRAVSRDGVAWSPCTGTGRGAVGAMEGFRAGLVAAAKEAERKWGARLAEAGHHCSRPTSLPGAPVARLAEAGPRGRITAPVEAVGARGPAALSEEAGGAGGLTPAAKP